MLGRPLDGMHKIEPYGYPLRTPLTLLRYLRPLRSYSQFKTCIGVGSSIMGNEWSQGSKGHRLTEHLRFPNSTPLTP
jgi:hypothetical protein